MAPLARRVPGVVTDVYGCLDSTSRRDGPRSGGMASVRALLVQEVIPGTRVAVINSDEDADDRPSSRHGRMAPWRARETCRRFSCRET